MPKGAKDREGRYTGLSAQAEAGLRVLMITRAGRMGPLRAGRRPFAVSRRWRPTADAATKSKSCPRPSARTIITASRRVPAAARSPDVTFHQFHLPSLGREPHSAGPLSPSPSRSEAALRPAVPCVGGPEGRAGSPRAGGRTSFTATRCTACWRSGCCRRRLRLPLVARFQGTIMHPYLESRLQLAAPLRGGAGTADAGRPLCDDQRRYPGRRGPVAAEPGSAGKRALLAQRP